MPSTVDSMALLRAGSVPITYYDVAGTIISINDIGAENLGRRREELVGVSIYDLLPDMAEELRRRATLVFSQRESLVFEDEVSLPDGVRHFRSVTSPVGDDNGETIGLQVISWEITDQRRAEQELAAATAAAADSERDHTLAMEAVRDGVWDWNLATGDFNLSPNFYALVGYTDAELEEGRVEWFYRVLHPDDRARIQTLLENHMAGKTPEYVAEYRWQHKNGDWRWALARGKVVERAEDGSPIRMLGTTIDVTERHELETRLAAAEKMEAIGRLAGGVAHDFNNLLTTVMGHLEFLRSAGLDEPHQADLDAIGSAVDRATRLTTQLLSFARRRRLSPRAVELSPILVELQTFLADLLGADIELTLNISHPLPQAYVDPSQFEQIVVNLAFNARDAMPDGGKLAFELSSCEVGSEQAVDNLAAGRYVQLTVRDTGHGMDQDTLQHVFEPFFTTKGAGEGTGLGLASCYGIVRQAGGTIEVDSAVDEGTTFRVYLPVAPDPDAGRASPSHPAGPVVLLVEDDDLVRRTGVRALEQHGYRVHEAASGDQALALPASILSNVDVLLTDIVMPGIKGNTLATQLRNRFPDLLVLFVSGYPHDAILRHGELADGAEFLAKPFKPTELHERLQELLAKRG